jgi:uncharacterized protein (TIGR00369 family)
MALIMLEPKLILEARDPEAPDPEARVREFCEASAFFHYLGMEFLSCGQGFCEIKLKLLPHHLQHTGVVHGGVIAALADQTAAAAAVGSLAADKTLVVADFKVQFLRAARGDFLLCRGSVLKPGRTLSFVEAEIFAFQAKTKVLVAKFSGTMASVPIPNPVEARSSGTPAA